MRIALSKLFLVPAFAAAVALAGASVRAETINVPFEFTAQDHCFPSGTYAVEQSPAKHLVTLHQIKGDATLNWTMGPGSAPENGNILLNFNVNSDGMHVLKAVQFGRRFTFEGSPFQHSPGAFQSNRRP